MNYKIIRAQLDAAPPEPPTMPDYPGPNFANSVGPWPPVPPPPNTEEPDVLPLPPEHWLEGGEPIGTTGFRVPWQVNEQRRREAYDKDPLLPDLEPPLEPGEEIGVSGFRMPAQPTGIAPSARAFRQAARPPLGEEAPFLFQPKPLERDVPRFGLRTFAEPIEEAARAFEQPEAPGPLPQRVGELVLKGLGVAGSPFVVPFQTAGGLISAGLQEASTPIGLARRLGIQPGDDVGQAIERTLAYERSRPEGERIVSQILTMVGAEVTTRAAIIGAQALARAPAVRAVGRTTAEAMASEAGGVGRVAKIQKIPAEIVGDFPVDFRTTLKELGLSQRLLRPSTEVSEVEIALSKLSMKDPRVRIAQEDFEFLTGAGRVPEAIPPPQRPPAAVPEAGAGPPPFPAPAAKQPWEMTKTEFFARAKVGEGPYVAGEGMTHRAAVRQALAEGKPVPPEVLADYPDLAAQARAAPRAPAVAPMSAARRLVTTPPGGRAFAKKLGVTGPEVSPEVAQAQEAWLQTPRGKRYVAIYGKPIKDMKEARALEAEWRAVSQETAPPAVPTAWETGAPRPFTFDPNSTANQGRFRLLSPDDIKGSYFTRQSSTPGVSYIMGKNEAGQVVTQSIRFDKAKFPEAKASQWWEANRQRFQPAEPPPTAVPPAVSPIRQAPLEIGDTVTYGNLRGKVVDISDPSRVSVEWPNGKVARLRRGTVRRVEAAAAPAEAPSVAAAPRAEPAVAPRAAPAPEAAPGGVPPREPPPELPVPTSADLMRAEAKRQAAEATTSAQIVQGLRQAWREYRLSPEGYATPPFGPRPPTAALPRAGAPPPRGPLMADLGNFDETVRGITQPNFLRRVSNLPGIRSIMPAFDPAQVANKPAQQALLGREALRLEGQSKTQQIMASLERLGLEDSIFGPRDSRGLLTRGSLAGRSLNDIRTYPARYTLTPQQREWVNAANEIERAKLEMLRRNGIDVKPLSFEEGGQYAGRRVYAKLDPATGDAIEAAFVSAGPGRPGAKAAFEKVRVFGTADEAVAAGFRYLPEGEALALNVRAAYNRVADKQMADWLLNRATWRTTGAPEEVKLAAEVAQNRLRKAIRLKAVIERQLRGERVPEATLRSIEAAYPEQIAVLRGEPTAAALRELRPVARQLQGEASQAWRQAVSARARAAERARQPAFEEFTIQSPAFAGKILTGKDAREIAETMNAAFGVRETGLQKVLRWVGQFNVPGRLFALAGDASSLFIQLIALPAYKPKAWALGARQFFETMVSQKFQVRYLDANREAIQQGRGIVLSGQGVEATETFRSGFWRVVGKPLEPFMRAYNASLDTAGIELWKALRHMATTPEKHAQLVQFINDIRGLSPSAGLSRTQRLLESGTILAPRYNRATAGLIIDIIRGDLRGVEARRALASAALAGGALFAMYSYLRGEDPLKRVNPIKVMPDGSVRRNPDFLMFEVAGQKLGPGGKVLSVTRLLTDVIATGIESPEDLVRFIDNQGPSMRNPFVRWVRGQIAPLGGTGWDVLSGRDFIGQPTTEDALQLSRAVLAENLVPVWIQSTALQGGGVEQRAERGVTEFFGGRAIPETASDRWRRFVESRSGGTEMERVPIAEQVRLRETAEGERLYQEAQAERAEHGRVDQARQRLDKFRDKRIADLNAAELTVKQGRASMEDFKEFMRDEGAKIRTQIETIESDPNYAEYFQRLEKRIEKHPSAVPEDAAYMQYLKVVNAPEFDRGVEGFDFDAREAVEKAFRQKYGERIWEYVQVRVQQGRREEPPLARAYRDGQEKMRDYWDGKGAVLAAPQRAAWDEWRTAEPARKLELERSAAYKSARSLIERARLAMRRKNTPEGVATDLYLVTFYGARPVNLGNIQLGRQGKLTFAGAPVPYTPPAGAGVPEEPRVPAPIPQPVFKKSSMFPPRRFLPDIPKRPQRPQRQFIRP